MGMRRVFRMVLIIAVLIQASAVVAAVDDVAKKIIRAARTDQGLCVYINTGSSESLTASLAKNSRMLVHEICFDEKMRSKTAVAIAKAGVVGQASVEKLPEHKLPYVPNLCTLIVVDDLAALQKLKISKDSLMKCLAPYGTLLAKNKGKWSKSIKERPDTMADYSHPNFLNTGNFVSGDTEFKFPLGVKWLAGLPKNVQQWASVRAWVVVGNKCFILTSNVIENAGPKAASKNLYLICRDAFNGLPLWKLPLHVQDAGAGLFYENADTLAADSKYVYTLRGENAVVVDSTTGKIVHTLKTTYQPQKMVKDGNVLLIGSWKERTNDNDFQNPYEESGWVWDRRMNKTNEGSLQAFDVKTGSLKWSQKRSVQTIRVMDNRVFTVVRNTSSGKKDFTDRQGRTRKVLRYDIGGTSITANDIKSGKEIWSVDNIKLGSEANLHMHLVADGVVIVAERRTAKIFALDAKTGSVLWTRAAVDVKKKRLGQRNIEMFCFVKGGVFFIDNEKYDIKSGKKVGSLVLGRGTMKQMCTPSIVIGDIVTNSRSNEYIDISSGSPEKIRYNASRGGCMEGMVPANGMFYTCQDNCQCAPGQINGFMALGPGTQLPSKTQFKAKRPVEKGSAFGKVAPKENDAATWAVYRGNNERSRSTTSPSPAALNVSWSAKLDLKLDSKMSGAWSARLADPVTPPVCAAGKVFAAVTETGNVLALDADSGKQLWSYQLPARVNGSPAIMGAICTIGCYDGWLYALSTDTGELVWRTRIAPVEQRIVENGQVVSSWPVNGSSLIVNGTIVACAGRGSEADNGIAVVQVDPKTGDTLFADVISPGPLFRIDLLSVQNGKVALHGVPIDLDLKKIGPAPARKRGRGIVHDFKQTNYMLDAYLEQFRLRAYDNIFGAWDSDGGVIRVAGGKIESYADLDAITIKNQWGKLMVSGEGKNWSSKVGRSDVLGMALNRAHLFTCSGGKVPAVAQVDRSSGKKIAKLKLPAAPVFDGVAVSGGKLFVALKDGSITCVGQ